MYQSIKNQARRVSSLSLSNPSGKNAWSKNLPDRRKQWLEMLGLLPLPQRTPLKTIITGKLKRDGYVVEKLHFQSLPGAYVPGNLYRPEKIDGRLPAVLYLCGHAPGGKFWPGYQAHPRWFARHGYVALVLDPIQLGEAQGIHHGTHRYGRWDWHSRGYTPAGMEVWNAMRALDYLGARADVDSSRMGVTGASGGGAMSWFLAAADERIKCAAPAYQTGSIEQLITDRATDGHCDCAFWLNYYQWCTPDIGALIAPRPLLIASGTEDVLWRPYAFRDVYLRIRHQYMKLGAAENVRLVEDVVPHGYTPKLRRAIFEWFNLHLKNNADPVTDDVTDYVEPEKNLRVFNGRPPRNDAMRRADSLLPAFAPAPPVKTRTQWAAYQRQALHKLRSLTFRHVSKNPMPALVEFRNDGGANNGETWGSHIFRTDDGLELRTRILRPAGAPRRPVVVFALPESATTGHYAKNRPDFAEDIVTACVEVRNTASTSIGPGYLWTLRRSYPLLGQTLPERQTADLLDGIKIVRQQPFAGPIILYGEGRTAAPAIYAALLDHEIAGVVLADAPATHTHPDTPEFPGILRIGDLPQNLALLFPRPVTFVGKTSAAFRWTEKPYRKFGKGRLIRHIASLKHWTLAICAMMFVGLHPGTSVAAEKISALATTFPIYQITRNIAHGVETSEVSLLLPPQLGCPHDYALTPADMRKIAGADLLIVNGLGMEEFLGMSTAAANPKLVIVNSSDGIRDILRHTDSDKDHHNDDRGDDAHHGGINPHLFASPRMAARLAKNIAAALSRANPAGADIYAANSRIYAEKMEALAGEFAALGRRLANNRIVTQHGVFDYLARDAGLRVVAVTQAHAGQDPSAAEILSLAQTVKRLDAGAIFTEPQYSGKIARIIAGEAGIPAAILDPAATGPTDAPLDYYESVMRGNLRTLENVLGAAPAEGAVPQHD